jgi:hypothetical protein
MKGSKIAPMPPITNASRNYNVWDIWIPSFFNSIPAPITVHNFSDGYKSKPITQPVQKNDAASPKNEQHFSQPTESLLVSPIYIILKQLKKNKRNIDIEPENEF